MNKNALSYAALAVSALFPATSPGVELLREEFDGYTAGTIVGQAGQATNMTGNWAGNLSGGSAVIGPGLSGNNALVITAPDRTQVSVAHTVPNWGTGQFWMSYLVNQPTTENAHMYVMAGDSFAGAFGHAWSSLWGINNTSGPGDVAYVTNETVRLVAYIDFDAGTTTMWVNPDPNTVPITDPLDLGFAPTAYKEEAQSSTPLLRVDSYPDITVDDIIIGTEYADVAIEVPDDPPVAPTATNPVDGAPSANVDVTLEWTANGATSYDVFLWKDGDAEPGAPTATVTSSSYDPPADLDPVSLYNWRIDSTNSGGTTVGNSWTFTTNDGVEPILPPDGVTDVPLDIPIQWTDNGAVSWDIYLWKDSESKPGSPTANVTDPEYVSGGLDASSLYNWEVVSNYSSGSPTTSSTWSFTTGTGVPGALLLHEEFDGYAAGSIIGQLALGTGLDPASPWALNGTAGTALIGTGLSGSNGLVIDADGTGDFDILVPHTIPGWGTGTFYMSFLWNETGFQGHLYVSGGGDFAGALGHPWQQVWAVNNDGNAVPYNQEQTYRVVAKIDNGAGTVTMWVDPTYEFDAPVAAKTELQNSAMTLGIRSYGTDGTIDDIRIGTDFASVTQIIDPVSDAPTLVITQNPNGTDLDFSWNSMPGMLYDLLSATDLSTNPSTWPPVGTNVGIPADGSGTNTLTIPRPADPSTFYVVNEYPAPPPPPLLSEDFESGDGGFTVATTLGTAWAQGTPDSDNDFSLVIDSGNGESTGCFAVGLGTFNSDANRGYYDANTATVLTSPAIDLTGIAAASLTFAEVLDFDEDAVGEVYVIDGSDAVIGGGPIYTVNGEVSVDWADANSGTPIALPAAAMGQSVRIEWRFTGGNFVDFLGWYIDDVIVSEN
ncbi:MAG: hypothetical protein AAGI48_13760 [Verrucomicrobiota bacterium]